MLTLFLYCFLLGCGLQEPEPLGGTDGLEPPPGAPPGSTPTAPPPLPPVLGDGPFPNAPADAAWTAVHDAEWTLRPASNQHDQPDNGSRLGIWSDTSAVSIIDVTGAPWGPASGRALSVKLPAGMRGGGSSAIIAQHRRAFDGVDGPLAWSSSRTDGSVYVGLWIRHRGSGGRPYTPLGAYPPGGSTNVAQKWLYFKATGIPDSIAFAHAIVGMINADGQGDEQRWMFPNWIPQFKARPGSTGCVTTGSGPSGSILTTTVRDEGWHLLEFLMLPNTFGDGQRPDANGVARFWLDGRLVMDKRDLVNYCSLQAVAGGALRWPISEVSLEPIYGGGLNPVPYDLFIDYGRMKVMYRKR